MKTNIIATLDKAVGTVAYTGYTAGAKKAASKSNHAAAVKYIAAEDQKCNIGESTAMGGALDPCEGRTGTSVIVAAEIALADFKNPYSTSNAAVRDSSVAHAAAGDMGYVNLEAADDTITVTTCYQNDCAAATDDVTNTIEVGE